MALPKIQRHNFSPNLAHFWSTVFPKFLTTKSRAARAGAGLPPLPAVRLLGQPVRGVYPVHAGQLSTTCSAPALFRTVIDGLLQPVHVDLLEEQARQARWCHEPCLHFFSVGSWWCCGRAISPSLLLVQGNNEFNPKSTRSMQWVDSSSWNVFSCEWLMVWKLI
jgi:hypothetical protein